LPQSLKLQRIGSKSTRIKTLRSLVVNRKKPKGKKKKKAYRLNFFLSGPGLFACGSLMFADFTRTDSSFFRW